MLRAFSYWLMRYRRNWRGTIVISVANPLLFLLGVGAGIGHLVDRHAPAQIAGVPYAAFFAPGMLAAAAMQTAFLESSGPVSFAARQGGYASATPTPLEPEQMMSGHLLFVAGRVLTSSAAFIAVMAAFGVSDGWWALALLPAALLTGLAFATPAAAWAVTVRQHRHINTVFRFVILPLYMFSGTFFAITQLPGWIRPLVVRITAVARHRPVPEPEPRHGHRRPQCAARRVPPGVLHRRSRPRPPHLPQRLHS